MRRVVSRFVRPVPLMVAAVVLVAVAVGGFVLTRGSSASATTTKKAFIVSLDSSCFATEEALSGRVPTEAAALRRYLDKVLPILRHADTGQHAIPLPRTGTPLAKQFLARFRDYVNALSRTRDALQHGDAMAQAAASADAHRAFADMIGMAEPLDSSSCPPLPQLP